MESGEKRYGSTNYPLAYCLIVRLTELHLFLAQNSILVVEPTIIVEPLVGVEPFIIIATLLGPTDLEEMDSGLS